MGETDLNGIDEADEMEQTSNTLYESRQVWQVVPENDGPATGPESDQTQVKPVYEDLEELLSHIDAGPTT